MYLHDVHEITCHRIRSSNDNLVHIPVDEIAIFRVLFAR